MNPPAPQPWAIPTADRAPRHNRILLTIALFKFFKAAAMITAGILAMTYENADLTKIAMHWVNKFRLDPDNVYVDWVLDHARLIHAQQLGLVAVGAFVYAILFLVEGIGLYREKAWGEYLVIVEVCLLMPVEIFGIYEKPDILRICLLLANIFILIYLLYLRFKTVRRRRHDQGIHVA